MCGAPAQATALVQASSKVESAPNGSDHTSEAAIFPEQPQQIEQQGRGKSIGVGIAVAVVLLVPLLLVVRNWQSSQLNEPAAAVTSTQPQANTEAVAVPQRVVKNPAKKVRATVPANQQAETETGVPATQEDPTELWKSVRSGNARAEVTLAKLYLDGNTVPQSCEQTHMLLLAASKKGNKAADTLLTGAYLERCQSNSTQ